MMNQTQLTSSVKKIFLFRQIPKREWTLKCRLVQSITKALLIKQVNRMLTVL